jgi:putative ABC transport system ATP-binding protein
MSNPGLRGGLTVGVEGLRKVYRTGTGVPVTALNGVTLTVPAGQVVALTGPSGSGKSTLLHLIGAMDSPDAGSVTLDDTNLTAITERQRVGIRRRIGFVFQRFHLLPALSVLDNVKAPILPYRVGFDPDDRARTLIEAVGLKGREADLPHKLSGGEQQRVAVARALINEPGLLVADEPTGNLDTATGSSIIDLLLRMHAERGLTLIIATHDPGVAARCHRILAMVDGSIRDDALQNYGSAG